MRRMRMFLISAGVLSLAISAAPAQAGAREQKETEQVDRNFPFQPGGQLILKNFSGTIHITGSNRANVVVHAVRRATRDRLQHIHLDIRATESEITIEANKKDDSWHEKNDNVVETDFEIEVPQRITLDVHAFSSDIHVESIEGKQKLYAFSGTIRVEDSSGPLNVETFSGEIKGDLERAAAAPEVEMKTFSGDIDVRLGSTPRGRIDFNSFSGSLDSNLPMTHSGNNRRHIQGDLGGGGTNLLEFKTFSGDVRIR